MQGKEGKVGQYIFIVSSLFFLLTVQASSTNTSADATIRPSTLYELEFVTLSFELYNNFTGNFELLTIDSHFCWQELGEKYPFKSDPENPMTFHSGETRTFFLHLFIPKILNDSEQSRECRVDTRVYGLWAEMPGHSNFINSIVVEQEREHSNQSNWMLWLILCMIVTVVVVVSIGIFFVRREG